MTRRVMAYGHRGALALAPENTLAGFRLAMASGADGVELDIHLSADGRVVVLHDENVKRTTGVNGLARELTLEQLRRLDAGVRHGGVFRGETIPTLEEALELLKGRGRVQIELKQEAPEAIAPAVELVRRMRMQPDCAFVSFSPQALTEAGRLAPEIARELIVKLPLWPVSRASAAGAAAVAMADFFVTQGVTRRAHDAGLTVSAGITNHESTIRSLVKTGVDAIYSDRPELLVGVLRDLGVKRL